ncbi:MAG: hypothetical protein HDS68_01865 [Bacteroidales bacterium]|nr:hypothetical protein [Bacteroidales bacterium]
MLILLIAAATGWAASPQRVNTITRNLKPLNHREGINATEPFDTVRATDDDVRLSGYEKTLRATRETIFISNRSDSREIGGIIFTVTYLDNSGRILHRRRVEAHPSIPPGETRRLDFPTWDRQMTFYYKGSPRPRVSSIPYDIAIAADTLLLTPQK